jgi:Tfp pilus assembly protein PilF
MDKPAAKAPSSRSLAGLAQIDAQQQQRAKAAAVVQAAGGPAANVIALLRANPVMLIGALAVLFGIGFGVYVYIQIAHPGLFVRQVQNTQPPPPAKPVSSEQQPSGAAGPAPAPASSETKSAPVAEMPVTPSAGPKPAASGTIAVPDTSRPAPAPVAASSVISAAPGAEAPRVAAPERLPAPEPRREGGSVRSEAAPQAPATAVPAASAAPVETPAVSRERIAVSQTNAQPRLNPLLTQAYGLLQKGNLEEASALYGKVSQSEPLNIDALLGLAYIAVQESRTDEATKHYLRILELSPRHTIAQAALIGLMGRADPSASEARLKQLIAREPSAFLHFVLGNLYAEQSHWSQAQQSYFQAHHLEPKNPDYAYNLAVGLDHLRQAKVALNFYRRAEQLALAQGRSNFDIKHARERIRILSSELE